MSLPRLQRLLVGLIALLAIGWAQTFGLQRGFVCDCGGMEFITQVDHCHGPHSAACHAEENADHSLAHSHDCDDDHDGAAGDTPDDRHEHAALIDSLIAKQQAEHAFSFSAPVQPAALPAWWEVVPLHVPAHASGTTAKPPPRAGPAELSPGFSWPQVLAQTIALRV